MDMTTDDFLKFSGNNLHIYESFIMLNAKLKNPCYDRIVVSISGGSDSDILLDLCTKLDVDKKYYMCFLTLVWSMKQQKNILHFWKISMV